MRNRRSLGTTIGMRKWYASKKRCKHCPKGIKPKILFKGVTPYINMCSQCFLLLTGETLSSQWDKYLKVGNSTGVTFEHYITWLKEKINSKNVKTKDQYEKES